jgi:hypothetical protein
MGIRTALQLRMEQKAFKGPPVSVFASQEGSQKGLGPSQFVIPAKAGIQGPMRYSLPLALDPRFRGDDGRESGDDGRESGGDGRKEGMTEDK